MRKIWDNQKARVSSKGMARVFDIEITPLPRVTPFWDREDVPRLEIVTNDGEVVGETNARYARDEDGNLITSSTRVAQAPKDWVPLDSVLKNPFTQASETSRASYIQTKAKKMGLAYPESLIKHLGSGIERVKVPPFWNKESISVLEPPSYFTIEDSEALIFYDLEGEHEFAPEKGAYGSVFGYRLRPGQMTGLPERTVLKIGGVDEYERFIQEEVHIEYAVMPQIRGPVFSEVFVSGSIETEDIRYYVTDILEALAFIHKLGLAYGDLKGTNVLLERETNKAVIIDLGSVSGPFKIEQNVYHQVTKTVLGTRDDAFYRPWKHIMSHKTNVYRAYDLASAKHKAQGNKELEGALVKEEVETRIYPYGGTWSDLSDLEHVGMMTYLLAVAGIPGVQGIIPVLKGADSTHVHLFMDPSAFMVPPMARADAATINDFIGKAVSGNSNDEEVLSHPFLAKVQGEELDHPGPLDDDDDEDQEEQKIDGTIHTLDRVRDLPSFLGPRGLDKAVSLLYQKRADCEPFLFPYYRVVHRAFDLDEDGDETSLEHLKGEKAPFIAFGLIRNGRKRDPAVLIKREGMPPVFFCPTYIQDSGHPVSEILPYIVVGVDGACELVTNLYLWHPSENLDLGFLWCNLFAHLCVNSSASGQNVLDSITSPFHTLFDFLAFFLSKALTFRGPDSGIAPHPFVFPTKVGLRDRDRGAHVFISVEKVGDFEPRTEGEWELKELALAIRDRGVTPDPFAIPDVGLGVPASPSLSVRGPPTTIGAPPFVPPHRGPRPSFMPGPPVLRQGSARDALDALLG